MTEEAFKNIVYPLRRDMLECAIRILQDKDDAFDCIQDSLALLWQNRIRLGEVENMRGYCFVTVKNCALRILKRKREVGYEDRSEASQESFERRMESREELGILKRGLESLPKMQREVIVLNALRGLSNEEIANVTGLTNTNVRTLLSRGRRTLKELYGKR